MMIESRVKFCNQKKINVSAPDFRSAWGWVRNDWGFFLSELNLLRATIGAKLVSSWFKCASCSPLWGRSSAGLVPCLCLNSCWSHSKSCDSMGKAPSILKSSSSYILTTYFNVLWENHTKLHTEFKINQTQIIQSRVLSHVLHLEVIFKLIGI